MSRKVRNVRLSDAEKQLISAAAGYDGDGWSTFMRNVAVRRAIKRVENRHDSLLSSDVQVERYSGDYKMSGEPNLRATFWHLLHRAGMKWCGWAHRRLMRARDSST